ncbi:MAG: NAD(P)H-binding protein [Burkholderiales bacterium]|nr:NAD(P)H-binding protein [Burkholderiales bacterium]
MKIALIAPTGNIGSAIAADALRRGHQVTGIVRSARAVPAALSGVSLKVADVLDAQALADAIAGHDAVASAYGPTADNVGQVRQVTEALLNAVRQASVRRLVVVGGAGSLEVAPGVQLVDTPSFPAAYKAIALAHRDAFNLLSTVKDVDWTFFAPAALISAGEKLGNFQVGSRTLLTDASGASKIHYPDYADAFVTALEQGQFVQDIATVAYR